MHGLLLTVSEFRQRALSDVDALVKELCGVTGRGGQPEIDAWRQSLPKIAGAFGAPSIAPMHVYFDRNGRTALEYPLPAAPYWCDMVLLGAKAERPAAVVVEIKDWLTRSDKPGRHEGLMNRQGREDLHPSDQVRGYTEYCRRFHSAVADHGAVVDGCVFLARDTLYSAYKEPPNDGSRRTIRSSRSPVCSS